MSLNFFGNIDGKMRDSRIGRDRDSRTSQMRESRINRRSIRRILRKQQGIARDESYENFKRIINEIMYKPRICDDSKDFSVNPSYTNFEVPYFMQCRERYVRARDLYEDQFQREISLLLENHTSAYEVARATRHLGITTLWPPLHNKREIITTQRYYFRLKPKQRSRLNYIMTHDFN